MTLFVAPTANPVFFRTYSRRNDNQRESWDDVCDRTVKALIKLGALTVNEATLIMEQQSALKTFPSGRWLWVGNTKWLEDPNNFYGSYNCSSLRLTDWRAFRLLMDLAMQGTGTGAMLEDKFISQLPTITTHLDVKVIGEIGSVEPYKRRENTEVRVQREYEEVCVFITVGDSRQGWVDSYHKLLELSSSDYGVKRLKVLVDVSNVRPSGEPLKGFGGTANPSMLEGLYPKIAKVLNKANGRKLTAVECCLIIDEAALVIVSGNIRRCLAYGSMVSTDKGRKAIQDIQIGDRVLTTKDYHPVTDKFEQGMQSVCRIITSGSQNSLRCTERHKIAVLNGGTYKMIPAGNLQRGDLLVRVSPNGAVAPDRILSVEWNVDTVETFDIEVAEVHEFVCEGLLVSNSAGMKQGSSTDEEFTQAKLNIWQQDEAGNWRIDPERDALRMSNHTKVYHTRPSLEECVDAVRQQYYSGEGAIQWAGEAVARASADLLPERSQQVKFIKAYEEGRGEAYLRKVSPGISERELKHRMERWGLNPCGEIIGADFLCNLSEIHLNNIDPFNFKEQEDAFKAGGIMVAALLHHNFPEERLAYSRELDPIVGVSFTGLFDFFVNAFGVDWLRWWEAGRPEDWSVGDPNGHPDDYKEIRKVYDVFGLSPDKQLDLESQNGCIYTVLEREYLTRWKKVVQDTVWDYCDRHGLKRPNRYTTCQPAGTKSLLTGASPGWSPAKAQRFIRRITFGKNDPVALACIDYGYSVIPSQSNKDENGNLLNDPFDPRCTEWLVEIPVAVNWADLPGADEIDISKFSVLAQVDFAMQVQQHYVTHNLSSTWEMREDEIEPLGKRIYQAIVNDEGYISAALLARFDDKQTYPRLPFEPIDKATYDRLSAEVLERRVTDDFQAALARYDKGDGAEAGPAGCDSDKCLLPEKKPE